jgi:hypothetical protein
MLHTLPVHAELNLCTHDPNLTKEISHGSSIILAQLFCVTDHSASSLQVPPLQVQEILDQFPEVFSEPSSLPPRRPCDHAIHLHPNSKPVILMPYRFSHFQKVEIEKIMEELLKNNFIQPSTSSFASPILLVKKKMVHGVCV